MPTQNMFETIYKIGAMIRISDYGELSRHKEDILNACKKMNIPCFLFPMAKTWKKFGDFYKRNRIEEELKKVCSDCCFGTHDLMFIDDKIYCCLRTLFANAIGADNEAVQNNCLDLEKDITEQQLIDFVQGKYLWQMCDYCDSPMQSIKPAEQIKKNRRKE